MKKNEYDRMSERESTYWWHVGRLKIIETTIKKYKPESAQRLTILNVGCGTGGTVNMLEKFGTVTNVDVSADAIRHMKQKGYKAKKVSGVKLPYKTSSFDMVVAFDVLEHIKNDSAALREWKRVISPKGRIFLTVPAYQWLWSGHDESLHHFRRYTRKLLSERVGSAHLRTIRISYAILFSLPLILGFRMLKKLFRRKITEESSYVEIPGFVNRTFIWLLYVESFFHKFINIPFGTSLIACLERSEK